MSMIYFLNSALKKTTNLVVKSECKDTIKNYQCQAFFELFLK